MRPIRSWPKSACGGMPRSGIIAAAGPRRPLLLHERTVALVQRPEGLLRRNGRAQLVVVPRALGLRGLLHLEEVGGVNLAAVGPNRPLAEQGVVGGGRLHLLDDLGPIVRLQ